MVALYFDQFAINLLYVKVIIKNRGDTFYVISFYCQAGMIYTAVQWQVVVIETLAFTNF